MPAVTAVIPAYNAEAYLAEAIDSVLAQTFGDWELIAVNDGSGDGTGAILADYAVRYPDRIRVLEQPNRGLAASRGRAVGEARGRWVAFLDADDIWLPHKLARQTEAAARHPGCGIVTCDALSFSQAGIRVSSLKEWYRPASGDVLENLLFGNWIPPSAAMVAREALERVRTYAVPPPGYGEDWLMWMQIAAESPVHFLDEVLVRRRIHAGAMSSQAEDTQFDCLMRNFAIVRGLIPRLAGPPDLVNEAVYRVSRNRGHRDWSALRLPEARRKLRFAARACPWRLAPRLSLAALVCVPDRWWRAGGAVWKRSKHFASDRYGRAKTELP